MRDKASIFVGNLAMFCTESDIKSHFSSCGEITDVSIKSDPKTGRQLSYGFVRFSKEKHAKIALDTMNGSLLCGRSLRIGKALKERSESEEASYSAPCSIPSVHVSYKAFQVHRIVNEESLRALYGQFGEVLDVTIKHATVDKEGNYQSGYGFIHYSSNEAGVSAAFEAVKCLMDTVIDDVNYISKISHALEKHLTSSVQSSNESVSSLDEDSWFELSTVEMNFNELRNSNSNNFKNRHRRISSADTWVNGFHNDSHPDSQPRNSEDTCPKDFDIPQPHHQQQQQQQQQQQLQQGGYVFSSPQRMDQYAFIKSQMSPNMVPLQMQPQFVSYQLPPQILAHQIPSSPVMPTYIYQSQPVYQPIYFPTQPSTLLFPAMQQSYCYGSSPAMSHSHTHTQGIAFGPMQPQGMVGGQGQPGQGQGSVVANTMSMDGCEYGSYQPIPMQQLPLAQSPMYIPVQCGYSPTGSAT